MLECSSLCVAQSQNVLRRRACDSYAHTHTCNAGPHRTAQEYRRQQTTRSSAHDHAPASHFPLRAIERSPDGTRVLQPPVQFELEREVKGGRLLFPCPNLPCLAFPFPSLALSYLLSMPLSRCIVIVTIPQSCGRRGPPAARVRGSATPQASSPVSAQVPQSPSQRVGS